MEPVRRSLVGVVLDEEASVTSKALAGAPLVDALSSLAVGLSTKHANLIKTYIPVLLSCNFFFTVLALFLSL